LEAGHRDLGNPGDLHGGNLGRGGARALLEHEAAPADRMHRDAALGFGGGHRAKLHDFASAPRSRAAISPLLGTAISGGDTAPIFRPIGAWMRASAASPMPCPLSRSTRRACVLVEPSAPI